VFKWWPFIFIFNWEKYGRWGKAVMWFSVRCSLKKKEVWDSALSWCNRQFFCRQSREVFAHFHAVAVKVFGLGEFGTFRVQLMLSFLNAWLIIAGASGALILRFAQNVMLFFCQIHWKIASDQIHDSKKGIQKSAHSPQLCEIFYNDSQGMPVLIIYCSIMLLQLLYRWQN
jgi:hypothetical protein